MNYFSTGYDFSSYNPTASIFNSYYPAPCSTTEGPPWGLQPEPNQSVTPPLVKRPPSVALKEPDWDNGFNVIKV